MQNIFSRGGKVGFLLKINHIYYKINLFESLFFGLVFKSIQWYNSPIRHRIVPRLVFYKN